MLPSIIQYIGKISFYFYIVSGQLSRLSFSQLISLIQTNIKCAHIKRNYQKFIVRDYRLL